MSSISESFSKNLRKIRESKNLSQTELAERLGLTRNAIYGYESGKFSVALDKIPTIAKALGVSETSLIGEGKVETIFAEPSPAQLIELLQRALRRSDKVDIGRIPMDILEMLSELDDQEVFEDFRTVLRGALKAKSLKRR